MDYARGSHIHRVSMFVHIEFAGMTTFAFVWNSSENSVSTESQGKRAGIPSAHCGNQIGLSADTPNRNEATSLRHYVF